MAHGINQTATSGEALTGKTMMSVRLTKPQLDLLVEIDTKPQSGTKSYKPLARLLELGLVTEEPGRFSDVYRITDAGRDALAKVAA